MIYKGLKILSAFLSAALIVSCTEDSALQQGSVSDGILPIENTTVHQLGDSFKVAYTSPVDWRMTMKENDTSAVPEWLTASVVSGKAGTTVITFTVDPNVDPNVDKCRKCEVKFSRKGDAEVMESFIISQEKAVLEVSETEFEFGWRKSEGEKSFDVETNLEWDYEVVGTDSTYFSVDITGVVNKDGTKGSGNAEDNAKVNVKVNAKAPNFGTQDYEAEITIKPVKRNNKGEKIESDKLDSKVRKALDGLTRTIKVSQDYLIFQVDDDELQSFSELGADYVDTASVNAEAYLTEQTITITCEADWDYDSSDVPDWLELIPSTEEDVDVGDRKAKCKTLEIKVKEPNPGESQRDAAIDFYVMADDDIREKRTVTIYQDGYEFDLSAPEDLSFDNLSTETKTLQLTTKGPWSIELDPDQKWLSMSPMSGVGDSKITIEAKDQNLLFEDLGYAMTIKSDLNDLDDLCQFSQDKFEFKVEWPNEFGSAMSRLDTGEYKVYVTSSGSWTLAIEADGSDDGSDWLNVSVNSGEAGEKIPVTINAKTANPDKESQRGKVIKITSDLHKNNDSWPEKALDSNKFIQDKFSFDIVRDDVDITKQPTNFVAYKEDANTSEFKMQCSAPWIIDVNRDWDDWISFSEYAGTGEKYPTITMTAEDNVYEKWDESRDAVITVKSDPLGDGSYSDSKTFKVTQDALVFTVAALNEYPVGALNDKDWAFSVLATEGLPWTMTVSDEDTWVGCETTDYKGSKDVTFKPFYNGTLSDRDGNITISSSVIKNLNPTTMTVKQSAYEFDNTPVTLDGFKELNPESKCFNLVCMGPWKVEACPDWVTVDPSDGSGDSKLTVTLDKNTATGDPRSCTIKIVSQVGGVEHTKEVTVVQNPFTWEITPSENISTDNVLKVDALNGGEGSVSLICSGSWKASADSAYVTVSTEKGEREGKVEVTGEGEGKVVVTVDPNYTTSQRTAKVTVSSDNNTDLKYELSVLQEAYVFELDTLFTEKISYKGGDVIKFKCSEEPDVTPTEGCNWLETKYEGNVLTITAQKNTTSSDREADVTISSPHNSDLEEKYNLIQEAPPAQEPAPAM